MSLAPEPKPTYLDPFTGASTSNRFLPGSYNNNFMHNLGRGIRDKVVDPASKFMDASMPNMASGALGGGAMGAVIGAIAAHYRHSQRMKHDPYYDGSLSGAWMKGGLVGGAAGAALGAYRGHTVMQKSASMFVHTDAAIVEAIARASVSSREKQQLIEQVASLAPPQRDELKRLLLTAAGFAVPSIIARFVLGKSLMVSALAGAVGAAAATALGAPLYNTGGARQPRLDLYGRRF